MKLFLDIEEEGQVVRSIEVEANDTDTVSALVMRAAIPMGVEADEVLEDLSLDGAPVEASWTLKRFNGHGHRLRHRRVCINLRFETEAVKRTFPARGLWSRVHQWGCAHFQVARDACANLELHDGTADGPALNESKPIGHFPGCKCVWLVKPGPEQNG